MRSRRTRAGTPAAIAPSGRSAFTTAPAPTTAWLPMRSAVEHLGSGAEPHVVSEHDAARRARLVDHGRICALELVAAADQVDLRREQGVRADRHARAREDLAVEAEVRVIAERDVAVLAGEDRPASEEDAAADVDAPVRRALGVEHHQVVDGDAVAQAHLVGVAQHDALAEHDSAPHASEQQRVEELAQQQSERPGHP